MTVPDPNAAQQPAQQPQAGTGGQMDYQQAYNQLLGRIQSGELIEKQVYTGLQQKYQEQFDAHKRTQDALAATNNEIANLQTQVTGLSATASSAQAEKAGMQSQLGELQTRVQRFELIGKEFPALIGWEAQGLLPQGPLDKLPEVLQQINAQLEQKGVQVKQQTLAGASALNSGPDANTAVAVTAAAKLKEYNEAVLGGKTPKAELQVKWNEYQELKAKEK